MDRHKWSPPERGQRRPLQHRQFDAPLEEKNMRNMVNELAQATARLCSQHRRARAGPCLNKAMSGEYPLQKMSQISGANISPCRDYEDSLAQVQNLTGMYYVLGYSIPAKETEVPRDQSAGGEKRLRGACPGRIFQPQAFSGLHGLRKDDPSPGRGADENPQLRTRRFPDERARLPDRRATSSCSSLPDPKENSSRPPGPE